MGKKFTKKDLMELLIKKAKGYYYNEEVYEYEKTQNKTKSIKNYNSYNENLNFFDIYDRVLTSNDKPNDTMELSNEKQYSQQCNENLTLIKKKVTTHYIPSDMLAIKILFEIYGKEIDYDNLEKLSDKELIELKNKLIEDTLNEN